MNNSLYQLTPWEEHQFWLEIIQDHAYFIFDALSPSEQQWINMTGQYIYELGKLLTKLHLINRDLPAHSETMIQFAREAYPVASNYYQFDGHLEKLRIQNQIIIKLTPTYFNGTLNEEQEYVRILGYYVLGKDPRPLSMAALVDLWLEDQQGHALLLINLLDPTEVILRKQASDYLDIFTALMAKQKQIHGYLRFMQPNFMVQHHFAEEIFEPVNRFTLFVKHIVELFQRDAVLNNTTLRFLEHQFPEACYFLRKLTLYAPELDVTDCLLTKPSVPNE